MNGRKVAYGLVAALVVWKVVLPVISFGFGLLGSGLYATTTAAGFTNPESESLRAAIRNVTTDYDQVRVPSRDQVCLASICTVGQSSWTYTVLLTGSAACS